MSRHFLLRCASMAEAWEDESFFKHGLEAGHGVDLQTSSTMFFSTTNGVPTTDRKLFECSGGGALSALASVAGGCHPHSAHGEPISLVQDGAHAEVAQPHGEWGGGNSLMLSRRVMMAAAGRYAPRGRPVEARPHDMSVCHATRHQVRVRKWRLGAERLSAFVANDQSRPPETPLGVLRPQAR